MAIDKFKLPENFEYNMRDHSQNSRRLIVNPLAIQSILESDILHNPQLIKDSRFLIESQEHFIEIILQDDYCWNPQGYIIDKIKDVPLILTGWTTPFNVIEHYIDCHDSQENDEMHAPIPHIEYFMMSVEYDNNPINDVIYYSKYSNKTRTFDIPYKFNICLMGEKFELNDEVAEKIRLKKLIELINLEKLKTESESDNE